MLMVSKGELKKKMLAYFRDVERTGEELVVTDNRVPVLRVSPLALKQGPDELFAGMRKKLRYLGDLFEDTSQEWAEL